ncbi:type II toxin-antitoxin system HicB family antitoxin [Microbulbifer sp. ALW1]|uniref:type II toxin-antitoxin system HicB family antitoxin n=1 Tax=Microbulbifer sp. (strain ALW1) TaxID=1516059 RepID=UPI00135AEB52|nr:type II toxin-antitoxin system HicB family antitoxin [Microbulbifer sp. ALW1]
MDKMFSYKGYKGSIEVDLEYNCLYGKILFIKDLVNYESQTVEGLEAEFKAAVDDYLADCAEMGVEPNASLSGTFNVRIGHELHEYASTQAYISGTSLNDWVKRLIDNDRLGKREIHNHTHNHVHAGHSIRMSLGRHQVSDDIWESRTPKIVQFRKPGSKSAHH